MTITITLGGLAVGALWVAGITVAIIDVFCPMALAPVSIGLMLGAATLTICGRIDRYAASWETAYDAGREVSKVRRIR